MTAIVYFSDGTIRVFSDVESVRKDRYERIIHLENGERLSDVIKVELIIEETHGW